MKKYCISVDWLQVCCYAKSCHTLLKMSIIVLIQDKSFVLFAKTCKHVLSHALLRYSKKKVQTISIVLIC